MTGFTMVDKAPASASSSGVKARSRAEMSSSFPMRFRLGSRRIAALSFCDTLPEKRAPAIVRKTFRADDPRQQTRLVRFCSIVRSASWLARNMERMRKRSRRP